MSNIQGLHDICVAKDLCIATAESCTAGLLSVKITSIPGASSFFKGGVIAYQNTIKINTLGVSQLVIEEKTEVCSDVVESMAKGVRKKFAVDFSIATTGYAGPTGGNKLNPIGTVFIAISSKKKTISKRFIFTGNRESVINQVIVHGLNFLIEEIKNYR